MRRGSLTRQISTTLSSMANFDGVDKYANKREVLENMIVSRTTLENYTKECCAFAQWVRAKHPDDRINTLEKLRPYAEEYLHRDKPGGGQYSAWTLCKQRAAIAKLYKESCRSICSDLPKRRRADIKRSRGTSSRSRSYNPKNHPEVETLGRGAGLRKSEFSRIRGRDVYEGSDGYLYVHVDKGKGGKEREARVDPAFAQAVQELASKRAPDERIIPQGSIPQKMDEHLNRRAYAQAMYKMVARPLNSLSKSEKYFCRGDAKGQVFDRQAMAMVSRWLGHGSFNRHTQQWEDRVNVIAGHYLV